MSVDRPGLTLWSLTIVRAQSHIGPQPMPLCFAEAPLPMQPRVFVIHAGAVERETISVVARAMGFQCVVTPTLEEALANVDRERISAALLDISGTMDDLDRIHRELRQLLVRFLGRVVVLTDERPAPEISGWIRKYCIPSVQRDRLAADLWPRLEAMVYPGLGVRRFAHAARLTFDTSVQPLPAGIRDSRPGTRQFVFETPSMTADIMIERPRESTRTTLVGQILRTSEPVAPLIDVPVVLKGPNGPMELTLTNEMGEFNFEFQNEPSITLEIEAYPNEVIVITPPALN